MKPPVLPRAILRSALLMLAATAALAGCGQTGPLYLPKPGPAVAVPSSGNAAAASGVVRPGDEAQMERPTQSTTIPRPGTR